jgi:hypothetical protein
MQHKNLQKGRTQKCRSLNQIIHRKRPALRQGHTLLLTHACIQFITTLGVGNAVVLTVLPIMQVKQQDKRRSKE